ncbi:MAG TPA: Lpg1974 family pore-forming outer membrane protein, partial [Myxococcota bacterium]|nr:Lpg1974 family pore-forming outer membrane protein [Myxococcota bacterium]
TALLLFSTGSSRADDKPPPAGGFFGTFEGHYLANFGETTRWGTSATLNPILPIANFNILPKWGGGGRVGLGYRAAAGWDVVALGAADWLSRSDQQVNAGFAPVFFNTLAPIFPGNFTAPNSQASAEAQLAYSYVDLEGGYNLKLGTSFDLRLFGGARYANFDQNIETTFSPSLGAAIPFQSDTRHETSYWGVGPRVGASSRLRICESPFYLVTAVSGSVLFGNMRVRESESISLFGPAFNPQNTMHTARTAYNADGEMGVLYDISPILQGLDVTVGYRVAGWFGVNDTRTASRFFASGESHANVATQGTFFRINVRY